MAKEFREELNGYLDDFARYIDKEGGSIPTKFDPKYLEREEGEVATTSLFERSRLDPTKPGHWQLLLDLLAISIYSQRTGRRTVWDSDKEDKLFRAVLKLRQASKTRKKVSVEKLCEELCKTPTYSKVSIGTLQARFNIVLRKKRLEAKEKNAAASLKRNLKWFAAR